MGVKLHAFRAEEEISGLEFSFSAFYEEEEKAKKKMCKCPPVLSRANNMRIREAGRSEQHSLSKGLAEPHRGHGCNPTAPEQPGLEKYGQEQTRSYQSAAALGQHLQRWQHHSCPQ